MSTTNSTKTLWLLLGISLIIIFLLIIQTLDALNKDFTINLIVELLGPLIIGIVVYWFLKPKLDFENTFNTKIDNIQKSIGGTLQNEIEEVNKKLNSLKLNLDLISQTVDTVVERGEVLPGVELVNIPIQEFNKLIARDLLELKNEFYFKGFVGNGIFMNPEIQYSLNKITPNELANFYIILTDPTSESFDEIPARRKEKEKKHQITVDKAKILINKILALNPNASIRLSLYKEKVNILNFIKIDKVIYLIIRPVKNFNEELKLRIEFDKCDKLIQNVIENHTHFIRVEALKIYPNE